jgi:hypothetical protein
LSEKNLSKFYARNEKPFGLAWEEWTGNWWKWFFSMPRMNHPAYDESRREINIAASGKSVLFLAGTVGGSAERTIILPKGKAVLMPVINIGTSYSENVNIRNKEEMLVYIQAHMNDIAKKEAWIDGEKILVTDEQRAQSGLFEFTFPSDNIYGAREGVTQGMGDGYWLFLRPLMPRIHHVITSGACMSGKIQIDVSVKLIVN